MGPSIGRVINNRYQFIFKLMNGDRQKNKSFTRHGFDLRKKQQQQQQRITKSFLFTCLFTFVYVTTLQNGPCLIGL